MDKCYEWVRGGTCTGVWRDNLKLILGRTRFQWEVVDWMNVAQNRDNWRAVVNTVRIFGLHKMRKNSDSP
jgi:hypothetical protein